MAVKKYFCRKHCKLLPYQSTPLVDISDHPALRTAGVRVLVKREDANHPLVSGNKWWKLKYNLQKAIEQGYSTLLTFGGAYSNHLFATAAATAAIGLKAIGIVRGEETLPLNPTLDFAKKQGMQLAYVSRSEYREKDDPVFLQKLHERFGDFYAIPEGGTNEYAVKGCEELGRLLDSISADTICLPVGTGGTMAGLIRGVTGKRIIGFPVLKDAEFLKPEIEELIGSETAVHWEILTEYSYGGYAKRHPVVSAFIDEFFRDTGIPLDFVYTGKMMCAVFDLVSKRYFKRGETILALHTGGLQGHST